ncbi:MAG: ABC transporter substrate-binding protein [Chloroflexota bacterium]|nr:ABC transporter substrate-binding protein [Chloroflexota bacterium]
MFLNDSNKRPKKALARLMFTIIAIMIMGLVVAACGGPSAPAEEPVEISPPTPAPTEMQEPTVEPTEDVYPLTLVDGMGREVVLPGPAQRIVSIAPSNTEILFAIGAGDQVVGRDEVSDYPPEALEIASIGSTYGELNTEAILVLEPDLVLAATITSPEQVQTIEVLGIPVFLIANPEDFSGLLENIKLVGILTGHEAEAEALAAGLDERVAAVTQKAAAAKLVSVFYEVDGTDPTAPWTTGAGTFQDVLIGLVAGENIAADIAGWGQMSLEEIVTRDPQVVIFGEGPWVPTTVESYSDRSGWGEIAAVVDSRVYGIDTNWVDRPGPRLVDALEEMAVMIHPELFE